MRENNLERFIKAQESEFKTALAEMLLDVVHFSADSGAGE